MPPFHTFPPVRPTSNPPGSPPSVSSAVLSHRSGAPMERRPVLPVGASDRHRPPRGGRNRNQAAPGAVAQPIAAREGPKPQRRSRYAPKGGQQTLRVRRHSSLERRCSHRHPPPGRGAKLLRIAQHAPGTARHDQSPQGGAPPPRVGSRQWPSMASFARPSGDAGPTGAPGAGGGPEGRSRLEARNAGVHTGILETPAAIPPHRAAGTRRDMINPPREVLRRPGLGPGKAWRREFRVLLKPKSRMKTPYDAGG